MSKLTVGVARWSLGGTPYYEVEDVPCPVNVYKGETCGNEIRVEQTGSGFAFASPVCDRCGTVWSESPEHREAVESIAEAAIREYVANFDPTDQQLRHAGML